MCIFAAIGCAMSLKYGEVMGYATKDIPAGSHVHDHNCDSEKLMK